MLSLVPPPFFDQQKASKIRVLIGCECSGEVRRAFETLNFDAFSCDLKPDAYRSNRHFQCDIREVLNDGWDFLAVMHPPCTRLCNSGARWLIKPPTGKTLAQMWQELDEGAALFSTCWNADIPCIAVENPVMHKHAKARIKNFQKATQTIQPWQFGEPAFKATGLYTKNLPLLTPTHVLTPPVKGTDEYKAWSKIHLAAPGPERSAFRSKTFTGIANAIALQWGQHLINHTTLWNSAA